MKKLLLLIAIVGTGFTANAQFNVGVNLGLPTGDISNVSSFSFGVEANYLFEVSDELKVGPTVSYVHFVGKSIDLVGFGPIDTPNISFMPVGAAARYGVSDKFVLGADLGLAIGVSNASGSDFFYRPMVGYNVSEKIMVQASYMGIATEGTSVATFGLGVMFGL